MRLLLDTHILLWGAVEPERLSRVASSLIESPDNEMVFSALSIWEIAIKTGFGRADFRHRRRYPAPESFRQWLCGTRCDRRPCGGAGGSAADSQRSVRPHACRSSHSRGIHASNVGPGGRQISGIHSTDLTYGRGYQRLRGRNRLASALRIQNDESVARAALRVRRLIGGDERHAELEPLADRLASRQIGLDAA
jgi:hypothetical protein